MAMVESVLPGRHPHSYFMAAAHVIHCGTRLLSILISSLRFLWLLQVVDDNWIGREELR